MSYGSTPRRAGSWSGRARMMTLSKSSWLTSRPCARTVAVYSCPGGTGSAPICPDGFTVFWAFLMWSQYLVNDTDVRFQSGLRGPVRADPSGAIQPAVDPYPAYELWPALGA